MTMTEPEGGKTMPAGPAIQPFRIDIPQDGPDDLKAPPADRSQDRSHHTPTGATGHGAGDGPLAPRRPPLPC